MKRCGLPRSRRSRRPARQKKAAAPTLSNSISLKHTINLNIVRATNNWGASLSDGSPTAVRSEDVVIQRPPREAARVEPSPKAGRPGPGDVCRRPRLWKPERRSPGVLEFGILLLAGWLGILAAAGTEAPPLLQRQYAEARERYVRQPEDPEAGWRFARAAFEVAEYATNNTERAELAERGIAAARQVLARDSNSVPGLYYLGLNLGQLARTRGIGALKLVDQMEALFKRACELDARFNYAGPERTLGLLYRDAPPIASVGSRSKARRHLQRAVELAPGYPDNRLNLIESYLRWGDRNGAVRELKALDALLPEARKEFAGPAWEASWKEWNQRIVQVRPKVEKPGQPLRAPRGEQGA